MSEVIARLQEHQSATPSTWRERAEWRQYEFALARIEELLPMVDDNTPANDRHAVELTVMSNVVIDYEKEHYPIGKPC